VPVDALQVRVAVDVVGGGDDGGCEGAAEIINVTGTV
jgi:hypothetical protein